MSPADFLSPLRPQSETTFWGWNAETWTAIGTVGATSVALIVALVGAFSKTIKAWLRGPKIVLLTHQIAVHSELIGVGEDVFWQLRLPVMNKPRREAAIELKFSSRLSKSSTAGVPSQPRHIYLFGGRNGVTSKHLTFQL